MRCSYEVEQLVGRWWWNYGEEDIAFGYQIAFYRGYAVSSAKVRTQRSQGYFHLQDIPREYLAAEAEPVYAG